MKKATILKLMSKKQFAYISSIISLIGVLLLQSLSLTKTIDNNSQDIFFQIEHKFNSSNRSTAQIGLISIDDKTIDTDYSSYSSPWGKDSWITRDLWIKQLALMAQVFQPKVLAFDIYFSPIGKLGAIGNNQDVQKIHEIESKGNLELHDELVEYEDRRAQGQAVPYLLFAFQFVNDDKSFGRLSSDEQTKQRIWSNRLNQCWLPLESVVLGKKVTIYHGLRLPMDEILSESFVNLGPINVSPDNDGTYRNVPLLYAYQSPETSEIRYIPSFALQAFLLSLDILPQDLKSPGHGFPCLTAIPGGQLRVQTEKKQWSVPIDDEYRMAIVPRFLFKAKNGPELLNVSFVDMIQLGMSKIQAFEQPRSISNPAGFSNVMLADQTAKRTKGMILIVGQTFTGGVDSGIFPLEQDAPRAVLHLHAINNLLQNDHLYNITQGNKMIIYVLLATVIAGLYLYVSTKTARLLTFALFIIYTVFAISMLICFKLVLPLVSPCALILFCFILNGKVNSTCQP